jgi:hypothetical protein
VQVRTVGLGGVHGRHEGVGDRVELGFGAGRRALSVCWFSPAIRRKRNRRAPPRRYRAIGNSRGAGKVEEVLPSTSVTRCRRRSSPKPVLCCC